MPLGESPVNSTVTSARCAIYTRKSSDEGLGQEFNSLDAQRECAEAYILSRASRAGPFWPQHYDDDGYTGANLQEFQRLRGFGYRQESPTLAERIVKGPVPSEE